MRLANATGNRRPAGKSAETTMMTRPADSKMATKRENLSATAAATMATKAKGSAILTNAGNHRGGFFILPFFDGLVPTKLALTWGRPLATNSPVIGSATSADAFPQVVFVIQLINFHPHKITP